MSSKELDKQVILVTGTSQGLGRYLAEHYLSLGWYVVGCSRTQVDLNSDRYIHFKSDISNEKSIREICHYIKRNFKKLDVLINNAASNPAYLSSALLSSDTIQSAYITNVHAPMIFCGEAIKIMMRAKFGRIINIGSMVTHHESFGGVLYSPSKAAINSYTRILAKEVYKNGITVNVVAPSAIKTELAESANQQSLMDVLSRNAISDYGEMSDVSNLVDFLIKKESSALTGQIFYLGGV